MPAIASNLRQLASFVVIGVLATAAHYSVLVLLVQLAHKPPVPATLLGYCLGGIISYGLNRRHTFKSGKRHREAVLRFVAVAAVGFLATALMMTLAVDWRHLPYLPAQIVVTGLVTIWSYAASRWWTFAERRHPVDRLLEDAGHAGLHEIDVGRRRGDPRLTSPLP